MVKKSFYYRSLLVLTLPVLFSFASFWGFQGHETINNKAIYCLSGDMFKFYKENADYITEHSVDPDKRRHSDEKEAPRHYIDIDHYVPPGEDPFAVMPRKWADASEKFSEDTLLTYGIVPWRVLQMSANLQEAFMQKDKNEILRLSAELGHYVADACVPLHSTENYDGQLTNQKGIHSFWETRLVELYINDYDLICDKATYIEDQQDYIWTLVEESFNNVELVLDAERVASQSLDADEKFIIDDSNGYEKMLPSPSFSALFNAGLDGMVEARMRRSIEAVSSFWFTAWVNAGQPDLSELE